MFTLHQKYSIKRTIRKLLWVLVGMICFTFSLVPFYNTFCKVTGINGKVDLERPTDLGGIGTNPLDDRVITVEFLVNHNQRMPWTFKPQHITMKVRPGEVASTAYYAKNTTKKTMTAQAIPSISPGLASRHFKKIKCFCFDSQQLGPSESANFILQFYLDPKLPKDIKRLTLSYTLFDITGKENPSKGIHG